MESDKYHEPSGSHSSTPPAPTHGQGGSLGVDISSSAPQPATSAPLHFHQVLDNIHDGRVGRASEMQVSPSKMINPKAPDDDFWKDTPRNPNEGVIRQVMSRASEIYEDYRERAGETLGDIKERASGVWQTVAGAVAVVSGKELAGRPSQMAHDQKMSVTELSQEPGLNANPFQTTPNPLPGFIPHGDVRTPNNEAKHAADVTHRETINQLLSA